MAVPRRVNHPKKESHTVAGFIIENKSKGAPPIEDGIEDALFLGIHAESHPDWKGEGKFGYDDGERYRFDFGVIDKDGNQVTYLVDPEDPDSDEKDLIVDALTNQSFHKKSNGYAIMKGVLTSAELAVIEAGQPFDIEPVIGRKVQVQVEKNKSGWPKVTAVLPARKAR